MATRSTQLRCALSDRPADLCCPSRRPSCSPSSVYTDLSAHGLAFVVAPSRDFSTALPGQFLGLANISSNGNGSNHFFAVELDTIQNKEFDDLNANHAGANVNGLRSEQSYYAGYYDDKDGSFRNLSLISREAMQVWVDYDDKDAQIT
ncbi:hypothetical protein GUJ93_ZPchr1044g22917, partial [Zizania palustris]